VAWIGGAPFFPISPDLREGSLFEALSSVSVDISPGAGLCVVPLFLASLTILPGHSRRVPGLGFPEHGRIPYGSPPPPPSRLFLDVPA